MKHLKIFLAVFALMLLAGVGCHIGGTDTNSYNDTYFPYDEYNSGGYDYDDSYDPYDSYDSGYGSYSDIPQGSQSVYACNLDQEFCEYVTAEISGPYVESAWNGSNTYYPSESLCESDGCYFVDSYTRDEWYFEF